LHLKWRHFAIKPHIEKMIDRIRKSNIPEFIITFVYYYYYYLLFQDSTRTFSKYNVI